MPFVVGCLALFAPRFAIVLVVLLSDYIGRAYETTVWPFLGFLFLPVTTLAYAWAINTHESVEGVYLAVVVVAVLIDLGVFGGSASHRGRSGRAKRRRDVEA